MSLLVAIIGLETLVLLALIIGMAADREARDSAWRRIADARRLNAEQAARCTGGTTRIPCATCPFHAPGRSRND